MSTKTYQCLSCCIKDTLRQPAQHARRQLHASAPRPARRRPAYPSIKQAEMEASKAREADIDARAAQLTPYTAREKDLLAMRYTPEQMKVIEAGEAAISPRDLAKQGRLRGDAFRPTYMDDFATLRPLVDKPIRLAVDDAQEQATKTRKSKSDKKLAIPGVKYSGSGEDEDPHMLRLSQQTGLDRNEMRKLRVKNLISHRVVNQTRMGKIQSLYFLTIAGNQDGMLGIGEGKAAEDEDGKRQAMMNAIRNMRPIARYEERTIYGEVEGKVGGSIVQLSARSPGFGNRCQHLIFELARAAGITDLAARTPRSRNKMNVVKAAFQALTKQTLPEDVAKARGRKMVDVRSVYYGGQVY
ncbi:28S ribosomal protein S5, mitochondrial [Friedmanniomyces endolithicus]|uniref:Small ribosomal subunit protein uS5m n=1 Tax=Friedmanniomyces endolithicus TaxID=329885 RepID=A0A4U0ULU3_9PEZI|nr:28S ribosomal protein S5, mitochondrial [Friedmanniomyces endolithicus]KAK0311180.1 28S ribosomal protein S5, mitochondrial [Friedmanniomyces endolithicus]KAK0320086.1 28S ribosomal protein S5, mitochondrial [Friedmanniomyces endolithicus]KAK0825895.1 28S ribosomal protein S5, mitochondrial [Friedmanniomyces endolithicus]KAK0923778.1 28S ribosomal protein S5, mitochondrial [Friedmanniomyces endolithicus]